MKGTIRICTICQERKGLKFFGVCVHQDVHDREESNRVQFATWKEASRRDITGGVAGACSPEGGGVAGEAAAPAAEDGAALELRSLRIHRVLGLLLNSSRRIRIGWPSCTQGWTVNQIPSTPWTLPTAASAPGRRAGSPGACERGREEGMALASKPL